MNKFTLEWMEMLFVPFSILWIWMASATTRQRLVQHPTSNITFAYVASNCGMVGSGICTRISSWSLKWLCAPMESAGKTRRRVKCGLHIHCYGWWLAVFQHESLHLIRPIWPSLEFVRYLPSKLFGQKKKQGELANNQIEAAGEQFNSVDAQSSSTHQMNNEDVLFKLRGGPDGCVCCSLALLCPWFQAHPHILHQSTTFTYN